MLERAVEEGDLASGQPVDALAHVLLAAADRVFAAFVDQLLSVDAVAAEQYAAIASSRERAGRPIGGFDALIAGVCRSKGAALATRNVADFEGTGLEIIDPWLQTSR